MSWTSEHLNMKVWISQCSQCAGLLILADDTKQRRIEDGKSFYCSNGHAQVFTKTKVQELEEQLASEARTAKYFEDLSDRLYKEKKEERKQRRRVTTMLKNHKQRVANGVCPCCGRSFVNLQRHMKTKHPNYPPKE